MFVDQEIIVRGDDPGVRRTYAARLWFLLFAAALLPFGAGAEPAPVKRVLIIQSFGITSPPLTSHAAAFATDIVEKMGESVELDEVSLDMARYGGPDMQEVIVEYLEKRQLKWQPDLVVPVGSPAGAFVARNRERLFSHTPILYTALDRRLLPAGALDNNATYVGQTFDLAGMVEDMLQIAPSTKNIAVVVGVTPLEQFWKESFQKAAAPYLDRINFIYFDDLSFAQMLEKAKTLPPDSFIFLLLLRRDAAGVTHNANAPLERLHQVANAPINAIFDHQMGLGIVGGRLHHHERVGQEAAAVAIRILDGEPASSIEAKLIERLPPRFDWRELQRWKIDPKRLPPQSTILFRPPSAWQQYRGWFIGGGSILIAQTLLLSALLANLIRRRRAERSLTESEARFRNMADSAPVLVWMSGPDKLGTFFNKAWLAFTGRTAEEELGERWMERVHPDDRERCLSICGSAFRKQEPFTMQLRLRRHDGVYRTITDQGVPRYDGEGTFLGYIGACVDITDQLEQQKALHEVQERVALAAEAAHLGVWELDLGTNEFWMSEEARDLLQLDRSSPITYEMFQARLHPDDRALRDAAVKKAIEGRGSYDMEYRISLPDQTVRWVAARARYQSNPETGQGRLLGVFVDVTERRQTEQLLQLAAEGSRLGVWDWNETTGELFWDRAMREIFDVQREGEITLDTFYNALYPPDREEVKRTWRHAVATGIPYELEYRVRRSDGTIGWVHARGRGYDDENGNPVRMIGIVFDITDRKKAEEEAQRRREQIELLSRVSLLGEMTASLAHELNQPLSAIVSNANAGTRFIDKGKGDPEVLREIMVDIEADGRRAHEIINSVRQTIKKGSDGASRQSINLNETIGRVIHMVQPDAIAHSCDIETSLAEDLPPIEANPGQIQQVLVNLMSNAFDSMRETARAQRKLDISTEANGDGTIRLSVRDRGAGIPGEIRGHIFDQFFTTKEEGLGMGLAIVRSIVESHGGHIAAESPNGGGARFCVTLPTTRNHHS